MQLNEVLNFFSKYIQSELGIVYAEHNAFQLQNRLEEIAKLLNVPNLEKLYEMAQTGVHGQFRQLLLDISTNNETSFFRDPKIFRAIETIFLDADSSRKEGCSPLRIWSAASSSGQEAISIAILIREYSEKKNCNIDFTITGTDVSERVLVKAKSGTYSELEMQRGMPPQFFKKYFKVSGDQWTTSGEITQAITFKKLNLKDAFFFPEKFQLILCRNVLIYQNVDGKKEILQRLTEALDPGGFLVLGSGESLLGLSSEYEQHNIDGAIIYRKKMVAQNVA